MSAHKAPTKRPPPASYRPRDYGAVPEAKPKRLLDTVFGAPMPRQRLIEMTPEKAAWTRRVRAERKRRRKHRRGRKGQ